MKKIIYVTPSLKKTGPTNQLYGIISNLPKEMKISIIVLNLDVRTEEYAKFSELNVRIIGFNFKGILKKKEKNKIDKIIVEINPDIIHSSGLRSDMYVKRLNKKYNVLTTVRNFPIEDYPAEFGRIKGFLAAVLHMKTLKKISNIITCSNSLKVKYNKKNIKSYTIQNGINEQIFKNNKLQKHIDFISVGLLNNRKNPLEIIETFNKYFPTKKVVFLGDGPLFEKCKNLANKNISFLGSVTIDVVVDYLNKSKYFISSSKSEGLPNAVLEAMGVGLPCILSNINQHVEIVGDELKCGVTYELGNKIELKKSIDKILKSDIDALSRGSSALIEKNFTSNQTAIKYYKKYLEVFEKNNYILIEDKEGCK